MESTLRQVLVKFSRVQARHRCPGRITTLQVAGCNTQFADKIKIKIKISEYISTHVLPCTHHHMVITTYEERNFNEVM
jgi:hypothetical protein